MTTISSEVRPALFRFVLIVIAWGLTATATADDWGAPDPRLFISENGRHGFKVLPKNTAGILFSLDDEGTEHVIWNKQLVNVPHQVFVADDGNHVVTVDTYADLGREHSLVIYDAEGQVFGDYRLEELLSEREIRDLVITTAPNRWWASEASFQYRDRGPEIKYFEIALKWGTVITVNLETGKLEIEGQPAGKEPAIVFDNRPEAGVPKEALAQARAKPADKRGLPGDNLTLHEITDGTIKTVRIRYFNKDSWRTEDQAREYVRRFLEHKSLNVFNFQIWSHGVGVPEIECIIEFTEEHRKKLRDENKPCENGRLLIWQTESCFRDATGRWWFVSAFDHFHRSHPKGNRENAK